MRPDQMESEIQGVIVVRGTSADLKMGNVSIIKEQYLQQTINIHLHINCPTPKGLVESITSAIRSIFQELPTAASKSPILQIEPHEQLSIKE